MTSILVIDDDMKSLANVLQMLEYEGFDVMQAENGKEGLALVYANQPDIVVSDVMMPELDGIGVLSALRSDPRSAQLPVVLISGHAETEIAKKSMELNAVSYLVKPFPVGDLLTVIRLALA